MKITIIGAGSVGATLGGRWAQGGHEVLFGVRDPKGEKAQAAVAAGGPNARATTVAEACAQAPLVVLATPWKATHDAIRAAGDLAGKIVVDCTNPLAGLEGLEIGHTTSAGEKVAEWAPGAKVVKAFNSTGANNMADPRYGDERAAMFVAGDDTDAKQQVMKLAQELDFEPIDVGGLKAARYLEPLAMLWIHMAYAAGHGREFAFRVVRR